MTQFQDGDLVLTLVTLQAQLLKRLDQSLTVHGISFTEFSVLMHLHAAPNRTLRRIDLADKTGLSASGVTRLLNPMHKIGLVGKEDSPRDARVSLVALTDAGERVFGEALQSFNQCAERFLEPLDDTQRQTLAGLAAALR